MTPHISWPKVWPRSGAPMASCSSPRQMWRSEPQIPPRVIFTSAASGSISGTGYSRSSKSPRCLVMTATRPFMALAPLLDRGLHLDAAGAPLLAGQGLPLALDEARLLVGPRGEPGDQLRSALVHGIRPFMLTVGVDSRRAGGGRLHQELLGGSQPGAEGNGDAERAERHLDAGQAAQQLDLVQAAEVPDPEDLALHLAETDAERQVERAVGVGDVGVGIAAGRHDHRGQGARVPVGLA